MRGRYTKVARLSRPLTAGTETARRRPRSCPGGGRETCPLVVMGSRNLSTWMRHRCAAFTERLPPFLRAG